MKIRLIKKMVKIGKLDGNKNKKWLRWNITKLNKKAYNMIKIGSGSLGEKWDNINAQIENLEQKLFRI